MERKIIELNKGISRVPTLGADGTLSECVNLAPKNGELRNIQRPAEIGGVTLRDEDVLVYVHQNGTYTHYITENAEEARFYWYDTSAHELGYLLETDDEGNITETVYQFSHVGNTLILLTSKGMNYFLWNGTGEGGYINLGTEMPSLDIQFALQSELVMDESYAQVKLYASTSSAKKYENLLKHVPITGATPVSGTITEWIDVSGLIEKDKWYKIQAYGWYSSGTGGGVFKYIRVYAFNEIGGSDSQFLYMHTAGNQDYDNMRGYKAEDSWKYLRVTIESSEAFDLYVSLYGSDENANVIIDRENDGYEQIEGPVVSYRNELATQDNKFVDPFFVRYAFKMFDGTYTKPSAPCLMIPNSGCVPTVRTEGILALPTADNPIQCDLVLSGFISQLQARILNSVTSLATLSSWKDLIKSVAIGVTQGVPLYNEGATDEEKKKCFNTNVESYLGGDSYTVSKISNMPSGSKLYDKYVRASEPEAYIQVNGIDMASEDFKKEKFFSFDLPHVPSYDKKLLNTCDNFYIIKEYDIEDISSSEITTTDFSTISLDEGTLDNLVGLPTISDNYLSLNTQIPQLAFAYNQRLNIANYIERKFDGYQPALLQGFQGYSGSDTQYRARVQLSENGETKYVDTDIQEMLYNDMSLLWFFYPSTSAKKATIYQYNDDAITATTEVLLTEHPTLTGAYWFGKFSEKVMDDVEKSDGETIFVDTTGEETTEGGETVVYAELDVSKAVGQQLYVRSVITTDYPNGYFDITTESGETSGHVTCKYLNKNGTVSYVRYPVQMVQSYWSLHINIDDETESVYVKLIDAAKGVENVITYTNPYTTANKVQRKSSATDPATDTYEKAVAEMSYPNQVLQSEVLNPFVFQASGLSTLASDKILAIKAVTKPLSQYQFGQNPLVAFTNDGIWGLTVTDNGTYAAPQAISRDIVTNVDAICQTDSALIYPTEQGLKALGVGGGSELLVPQAYGSESFNLNNVSDDIYTQPKSLWVPEFKYSNIYVPDQDIFINILKTCNICYDYAHQYIHIYPTTKYESTWYKHYVITENGEFVSYIKEDETMPTAIVQGYPSSYIQIGTSLYKYENFDESSDDNMFKYGLVLTRPVSFDYLNTMKVISDLRLMYSKNQVVRGGVTVKVKIPTICKVAILASNDQLKWIILPSLRRHSYKWYRFAIFTRMTDKDALQGIITDIETRRTDKLR